MKRFLILFSLCLVSLLQGLMAADKPKLVVVVSIDQMRYDYLERFAGHFTEGGFNLFLNGGANFTNAHYAHSSTYTGAGHAVMLSGSQANANGIVANEWLDRETYKLVYCVADKGALILDNEDAEGRSPINFNGSTVGDELKLAHANRPRVVAVSYKDRAAILMGGKLADAAFWVIDGQFVTSDYYMKVLPDWVEAYNAKGKIDAYFGKTWNRILPPEAYEIQGPDDFLNEMDDVGRYQAFPHKIDGGSPTITKDFYKSFSYSPFGNEIVVDFAREAILQGALGQGEATDMIAIGLSSNDLVGHAYGPDSHEMMDITLRTDRLLAGFYTFLDEYIGLENCTLVLTSDHGVSSMPEKVLLINDRVPAGRINDDEVAASLEETMSAAFGSPGPDDRWIYASWDNIYINHELLSINGVDREVAENVVKAALEEMESVQAAYTRTQLLQGRIIDELGQKALLSYNRNNSGDVYYQLKPYFIKNFHYGSSHGSPYSCDNHVPLLLYGVGIKPGTYHKEVYMSGLAPTLTQILGTPAPAMCIGKVLF